MQIKSSLEEWISSVLSLSKLGQDLEQAKLYFYRQVLTADGLLEPQLKLVCICQLPLNPDNLIQGNPSKFAENYYRELIQCPSCSFMHHVQCLRAAGTYQKCHACQTNLAPQIKADYQQKLVQ